MPYIDSFILLTAILNNNNYSNFHSQFFFPLIINLSKKTFLLIHNISKIKKLNLISIFFLLQLILKKKNKIKYFKKNLFKNINNISYMFIK